MEKRIEKVCEYSMTWLEDEPDFHDGIHAMCENPKQIRRAINFLSTLTDEELEDIWYFSFDVTLKRENDYEQK